jgi:hypothetical protein
VDACYAEKLTSTFFTILQPFMAEQDSILILDNKNIDRTRWDGCVEEATNSLLYAQSFYLDAIAPKWQALIHNDYEWVLPLVSNKKFGIRYLYQPNFTQQLGVFFKKDAIVPWNEIIARIQKNFPFCEVNWNYKTPVHLLPDGLHSEPATNFILDLSPPYESISANYNNDLKKNLKQSTKFVLEYKKGIDYEESIGLYIKHYGSRMAHVTDHHYDAFKTICHFAAANNRLVCRKATNANNETISVALLLSDNKRLYNLMNTTTNEGRRMHANHFLIDSIIKEYCNHNLLLDFEGSDLVGVKAFYENFGAINQPYFKISYNNLPWPLRLFKK